MSRRAITWSLWLLFVCTLPLPYFMIETGRVPMVQLAIFALLTLPLAFSDPGLSTRFIAGLFTFQSLLYGWLLYLVARRAAAVIERRVDPARRLALIAALAAVVVGGAVLFKPYRAPLSHGPGRTNLVGVFSR